METPPLYDIENAARNIGVAASTLRYWENEGLIRAQRNRTNDYRQYTLHDLIDVSEIAFYRKLGVSVKELKGYRTISVEALDHALHRSDCEAKQRIEELESMRIRLARQRALIAQVERLKRVAMQPSEPTMNHLSEIDFDDPHVWALLVDEPSRYGVVIEAKKPQAIQEAMVDISSPHTKTLWEHAPSKESQPYLECLLHLDTSTGASNILEILEQARALQQEPSRVIGTYLLTATEESGGPRRDFYHAWVL